MGTQPQSGHNGHCAPGSCGCVAGINNRTERLLYISINIMQDLGQIYIYSVLVVSYDVGYEAVVRVTSTT
jgi:hypothetical protein